MAGGSAILGLHCGVQASLVVICRVNCPVGRGILGPQPGIALWSPAWTVKVKVAQSCLTLCDPMNYTIHGILQARILECEALPFSRGSSQPRDRTCIGRRVLHHWTTREVPLFFLDAGSASENCGLCLQSSHFLSLP